MVGEGRAGRGDDDEVAPTSALGDRSVPEGGDGDLGRVGAGARRRLPSRRTTLLTALVVVAAIVPAVLASTLGGADGHENVRGRADDAASDGAPEPDAATKAGGAELAPAGSAPAPGAAEPSVPATDAPSASTPAGCIPGPANAPGTADPWGGCWPGPQNTGYPHGVAGDTRAPVTLTDYTGPLTISTCGTVIDSVRVDGDLRITAGNGTHSPDTPCVTIRNSLVLGTIHTDDIDQGPVVIRDTEVDVPGGAYWANIGFYNTFDWRTDSHGGHGTIKCAGYCESHDSWVHGMHLDGEFHYNAFGSNGIDTADAHFLIDHAYADCGGFGSRSSTVEDGAGCSSDIGFYGDFAPIRNITIDRTYFASAATAGEFAHWQPGYCLSPGNHAGKPYPAASDLAVTDSVFARGPTGGCGTYGAVNNWQSGDGNVWTGNVWDDGSAIDP
jgi:hypothetical protein